MPASAAVSGGSRAIPRVILAFAVCAGFAGSSARAGGVNWLDDLLRQIAHEAAAGARSAAHGSSEAARVELKSTSRLAGRELDLGLEQIARRAGTFSHEAEAIEAPAQAALESRFRQLITDSTAREVFASLKPAEKRVLVEMGETVANLARKNPGEAAAMIERLGPEGLMAVRAFGEDVAPVLAKEGPEAIGVLRKTGRPGWEFFTTTVLPHKKKLVAAGVFAAFLADPERFVDYAGRATQYAASEFARAGVQLAAAVSAASFAGLDQGIGRWLAARGIDSPLVRAAAMALAVMTAAVALLMLLGMPVRFAIRPFLWMMRPLRILKRG